MVGGDSHYTIKLDKNGLRYGVASRFNLDRVVFNERMIWNMLWNAPSKGCGGNTETVAQKVCRTHRA